MASLSEISAFNTLFSGYTKYHGQFIPSGVKDAKGKMGGSASTVPGVLGTKDWEDHISGKVGVGVVPTDEQGLSWFSVIDFDEYRDEKRIARIIQVIDEYQLPFIPCLSKSGGLHLYSFYKMPQSSSAIKDHLKLWLTVFGLPQTLEIFPKQRKVTPKDPTKPDDKKENKGSWINIPYFGNTRPALDVAMQPISLTEFIDIAKAKQVTFDELKEKYESLPFNDGPPCLQSLWMMNDTPLAEMYLFNFGVYEKSAHPGDWKEKLKEHNDRLDDPLAETRVEGEVIASHEKTTYSYRCSEEPICSRCNRPQCVLRPHGKEGTEISSLDFGQLTQVMSDPQPYYTWVINSKTMIFYTEADLRAQDKFADQVMRHLHIVPNRIKQEKWVEILKKAFFNIVVENVDASSDMGPGALLLEYLWEFLYVRPRASKADQIISFERAYLDSNTGVFYFRKTSFAKFLESKNFRQFTGVQIQERLKRSGLTQSFLYVGKKQGQRAFWSISEVDIGRFAPVGDDQDIAPSDNDYREGGGEF